MYWTGLIITASLLFAYCWLLLVYRQWFLQLPLFTLKPLQEPSTAFSVIIPARNEEDSIFHCLQSVLQQHYPPDLYEVIVVNDHSTDQTENIIRLLQEKHGNLQLINLKDHLDNKAMIAYKKKAIELAVSKSKHSWIVTTDADCLVSNNWLAAMDQLIQEKDPVFIAAPVMFTSNHSFLSIFQLLDFMSLQGITAAAVSAGYHTMCNGANIAYRKQVFFEVGQFQGIDHLASGDDMLLMHKIKLRYPDKMGYLNCTESIVQTAPMPDWKSFINQRIRWASKASQYRDKSIFWVLALVYAVNLALLILLLISPFIQGAFTNWLILIIAKTIIELSFMIPVSGFYRKTKALRWFPLMQPFHILYTVIAGWFGKFGTYQWKGRNSR